MHNIRYLLVCMKIPIIKIVFTMVLLSSSLLGYAQFLGGEANGHANIRLPNVVCSVINSNPFLGGEADGHAHIRLSNVVCSVINSNPFLGGEDDGHAHIRLSNVACSIINNNPFAGGEDDGHANIRLSNVACPVINNNPFAGGEDDGHANTRLSNVVCPVVNNNPFLGGDFDGYANSRLTNISAILCLNIVLPIELLTFDAKLNGKVVDLFWSTASEINNDYFTIERSKNGIAFEKVIDVDGAGNSLSVLHYATVDKAPFEGISYYRLKQTDFNGQSKYSNMVSVSFNAINVKIYPVPFTDELTIEIRGSNKPVGFEILNALGIIVYRGSFIQKATIKPFYMPAGIYFIKLQNDSIFEIHKIIKE